jgi:hypothetical protein
MSDDDPLLTPHQAERAREREAEREAEANPPKSDWAVWLSLTSMVLMIVVWVAALIKFAA